MLIEVMCGLVQCSGEMQTIETNVRPVSSYMISLSVFHSGPNVGYIGLPTKELRLVRTKSCRNRNIPQQTVHAIESLYYRTEILSEFIVLSHQKGLEEKQLKIYPGYA